MAMPKRGTRSIIVGSHNFRWFVKAEEYQSISFVIESEEDSRYQVVGGFFWEEGFKITPRMIREAVEQAIGHGWKPGLSETKRFIVDSRKIGIDKKVLWSPAYFNRKQELVVGEVKLYYFRKILGFSPVYGFEFSWGEFSPARDFLASCEILEAIHPKMGPLRRIESVGSRFEFHSDTEEKVMVLDFENEIHTQDWHVSVQLGAFVEVNPEKI